MPRTLGSLLALLVLALAAAAVVLLPSAVTEPFRYHTPELIEQIYVLRSWGTTLSVVLLAAGALIAFRMWRSRTSLWPPLLATLPVVVLMAAVFFSRQHIAEWAMFAPIETIDFNAVFDASHVDEADYVMSVRVGDEARAYPILMVAYYHIVNDEIDGEPFAVSY